MTTIAMRDIHSRLTITIVDLPTRVRGFCSWRVMCVSGFSNLPTHNANLFANLIWLLASTQSARTTANPESATPHSLGIK